MNTELLETSLAALRAQDAELRELAKRVGARARGVQEEINAIAGRRLLYTLCGEINFTASQDGQRGAPVTMSVSKDGPFVMTHYPVISWRPALPTTATNLGRWSPIRSYQLPDQQFTGGLSDFDVIDVSYELFDAGNQGAFQNLTVSGHLVSSSDNLMPLAIPNLFAPNATIQLLPTYNNINFSPDFEVPTTGGILHVDLLGYRIVNN